MGETTRYGYEKRIKYLTEQNNKLFEERRIYKDICDTIHTTLISLMKEGKSLSQVWILDQFRKAWK